MSAIYVTFAQRVLLGPQYDSFDLFWQATLVGSGYAYSFNHTSFATSVGPHAIGPPHGLECQVAPGVSDFPIVLPVGYRVDEADALEFAAADTSFPVATVVAVVVHHDDRPLWYLDGASFPGLPAATLGGAVELQFTPDAPVVAFA